MTKKKEKGFTLIELIGVLVIMAILALIVTPLVMNIIRKARVAADKRSIDAYGRSIELAIAGYLLDNGKFPTEVSQLTIEYSGDTVSCETTQINPDSSVYLAGCTVKNRTVEGYTYGKDKQPKIYSVGDQITYNGVNYYVIKNSGANEQAVTLLKATPLTVDEVNQYGGVGTENNHVNRYTVSSIATASNQNGYGGMAYYSSETCGYVNSNWEETGCITLYASSDIKYVVDKWAQAKVLSGLVESRLITKDEYVGLSNEEQRVTDTGEQYNILSPQYNWMYNSNYSYWTNTSYADSLSKVWGVRNSGALGSGVDYGSATVYSGDNGVVRPVIVLSKSAL